jgi:DNA-binding response OmpR family regulator
MLVKKNERHNSNRIIFVAGDERPGDLALDAVKLPKGYEIHIFNTGSDFMNAINDDFDVAIIDVNLQQMNGIQALIELRKKKPQSLLIVVSNNNIDHYRMEALEMGADYFLPKPLKIDALENILKDNFGDFVETRHST